MENNTTPQTPPVVETKTIVKPLENKNNKLIPILGLAILLLLTMVIFLGYQNMNLQKQLIAEKVSPTPSPTATSSASIDVPLPDNPNMISATKQISPDEKLAVWLNGKDYGPTELVVANADGTNPQIIKNYDNLNGFVGLSSPTWSPDNTRIAYFTFTQVQDSDLSVGATINLYTINPNGKGLILLKENIHTSIANYNTTNLKWTSTGITYTDYSNSADGELITVPAK